MRVASIEKLGIANSILVQKIKGLGTLGKLNLLGSVVGSVFEPVLPELELCQAEDFCDQFLEDSLIKCCFAMNKYVAWS